jgi:muconolactone delta-isomerase
MWVSDWETFCRDSTGVLPLAIGTAIIGDQIDMKAGATGPVFTAGWLVVSVLEDITAAGNGTLTFALVSDAQIPISTDGSATEHIECNAVATSTTPIPAGTLLACVRIPDGEYERYAGLMLATAGAALTEGAINAFLTDMPMPR